MSSACACPPDPQEPNPKFHSLTTKPQNYALNTQVSQVAAWLGVPLPFSARRRDGDGRGGGGGGSSSKTRNTKLCLQVKKVCKTHKA